MSDAPDPDDRTVSPETTRRAHALRRARAKLAYTAPRLATGYVRALESSERRAGLRATRLAQGLSAGELARRAGVSATTVFRIEEGKTSPRPHIVRRICTALDCAPWEIEEFVAALRPGGRSSGESSMDMTSP